MSSREVVDSDDNDYDPDFESAAAINNWNIRNMNLTRPREHSEGKFSAKEAEENFFESNFDVTSSNMNNNNLSISQL